FRADHPFL
nr:ovokinin [Gallus gallus]